MPNIYKSREHIPELNGVILGGITVVIDDPVEVRGLQAMCSVTSSPLPSEHDSSSPRPEYKPLEGVYNFLNAPSPYLDLDKWLRMPFLALGADSKNYQD